MKIALAGLLLSVARIVTVARIVAARVHVELRRTDALHGLRLLVQLLQARRLLPCIVFQAVDVLIEPLVRKALIDLRLDQRRVVILSPPSLYGIGSGRDSRPTAGDSSKTAYPRRRQWGHEVRSMFTRLHVHALPGAPPVMIE